MCPLMKRLARARRSTRSIKLLHILYSFLHGKFHSTYYGMQHSQVQFTRAILSA